MNARTIWMCFALLVQFSFQFFNQITCAFLNCLKVSKLKFLYHYFILIWKSTLLSNFDSNLLVLLNNFEKKETEKKYIQRIHYIHLTSNIILLHIWIIIRNIRSLHLTKKYGTLEFSINANIIKMQTLTFLFMYNFSHVL